MRKTKEISKYELEWQMVRVKVKGALNDKNTLHEKFKIIRNYFQETYTYDRWERSYNWLEGFYRGIKRFSCESILLLIEDEFAYYNANKPQINVINKNFNKTFNDYDITLRWKLYKDLFNTNKKWLQGGYFHKECNGFIDELYNSFLEDSIQIKQNYSFEYLLQLRSNSFKTLKTHKFFF